MDLLALAASVSVLGAVLTLSLLLLSGGAVRERVRGRLEGLMAGGLSVVEGSAIAALRENRSAWGFLRYVVSGAWTERMQQDLRRADSRLQPGVFLAVVVAAIGFQVPQVWIKNRQAARIRKLEEQLPETLTLVANSLKAGFGLLQALSLAAEQLE